jgi:murein DD-endopeptidase MepM/ murein hydrolase activator NlpD
VVDLKRFTFTFLIFLLLVPALPAWIPVSHAGAAEIKVSHKARSLQPGEVVLLEIAASSEIRRLRAEVFGRDFPLFAEGEGLRWTGLVGIDLDTKPGRYTIRFTGTDAKGGAITSQYALAVAGKTFPTRRLTVDEKYVTPPAQVQARIKAESERVGAIFAAVSPSRYWQGAFRVPVPGPPISEFGKRSVYNGQPRSPHGGTDFQGATGTPILAPNAGKVILATNLYFSGNTVILDHGCGLYSYLGHMSAILVHEGDPVVTGQTLGKVGATGVVTGPHLHWTVRLAGARVDPMSLLYLLGE